MVDELGDPAIIDLAIQGSADGGVIYDVSIASEAGGVLLVLLAGFRRPVHAALALVPVAIGFCWTLGIMGLAGIAIDVAEEVCAKLAHDGFHPTYGARPLKRAIEARVMTPIAARIAAHGGAALLSSRNAP